MEAITTFTAPYVALPMENVDTDQIIPARFLKTTNKAGLGNNLFADWRYTANGTPRPDFVLNQLPEQGAQVLVAGHNFGCGSSREHAPWALLGYGFRAVVSTYFADIFRNNALKNGLLPIVVDPATLDELMSAYETLPAPTVTVDLADQRLTGPGGRSVAFPVDPFAKHCLLAGVDQLGFLLAAVPDIAIYEASHAGRVQLT